MNINLIYVAWCFTAGMGTGLFYFAGLWWTLKKMSAFEQPAVWLLVSFLVRSAISLSTIYLVAAGNWAGMLFCLFGFLLMRMLWVSKNKRIIYSG